MNKVHVDCFNQSNLPVPAYGTEKSSGFDLRADIARYVVGGLPPDCYNGSIDINTETGAITMHQFSRLVVPTGIHLDLPEGYEVQVRPRSGLAKNYGITILNTPGTVDEDYTGEIHVILFNTGTIPFTFGQGDRIAQGVIARYEQAEFNVVPTMDGFKVTARGNKGHGHTGIK